MISLAKMRQCSGCGSVKNDVIFNSYLGSGAGPCGIKIPNKMKEIKISQYVDDCNFYLTQKKNLLKT